MSENDEKIHELKDILVMAKQIKTEPRKLT